MKKVRRIVFLISVVAFIVLFVLDMRKMRTMARGSRAASDSRLPSTHIMSREDSALISPKYIGQVKCYQNVNYKLIDPVSFLAVDDTFQLIIFRIHLETDQPLAKILNSGIGNSQQSDAETYSEVDLTDFSRFDWRPVPTMQTRNIFLSLYGDSLSNGILNDSIASYHLLCKNLSIKYEKNGVVQALLTCGEITPSDILFLKRGKIVYFMLMTTDKPNSLIPREILYDLIMGI